MSLYNIWKSHYLLVKRRGGWFINREKEVLFYEGDPFPLIVRGTRSASWFTKHLLVRWSWRSQLKYSSPPWVDRNNQRQLIQGGGGGDSQADRSKGEEDDYSKNLRITAQAVMPLGRRGLLLRLIILYFREIEWQRTKRPVHPLVLVNKYNMIVINIYFIEMNVSLWVSFKIILFCCLRPFTVRLLQNTS